MKHELPPLPYAYNALEPYIDEQTMRIHHDKHHQAYVDKLNAALEKHVDLQSKSAIELVKNLSVVPDDIRTAVRNHGGGHVNHSFFWQLLKPGTVPQGKLHDAILKKFQSMEEFQKKFSEKAMNRFGSGWVWLVICNGELEIVDTLNQDSPLTDAMPPIIGLDVWEHAYYLKYQNRRAEYIQAFFNVINWEQAEQNYSHSRQ